MRMEDKASHLLALLHCSPPAEHWLVVCRAIDVLLGEDAANLINVDRQCMSRDRASLLATSGSILAAITISQGEGCSRACATPLQMQVGKPLKGCEVVLHIYSCSNLRYCLSHQP